MVMFRNDSDDITFGKKAGSGDISVDHNDVYYKMIAVLDIFPEWIYNKVCFKRRRQR